MLDTLVSEGHLQSGDDLDAVGFKTVLGKDLSGCVKADERVLEALEGFKEVAPPKPCLRGGYPLLPAEAS